MTTWGELRCGDRIADNAGRQWRVYNDPTSTNSHQVVVGITDEKAFHLVLQEAEKQVTKLGARAEIGDDLTVVHEDGHVVYTDAEPSLEEQVAVIEDVFGADKVELLASETAAETAVREEGGPYPDDLTDLQLRTHLFLVHRQYVGDVTHHAALVEHHKRGHELADGIPHTHERSGK